MTVYDRYRQKLNIFFMIIGVLSIIMGLFLCIVSEITGKENSYSFSYPLKTMEKKETKIQHLDDKNEIIRLRVLANSNSREDQRLKLKVRDVVLGELEGVIKEKKTPDHALDIIKKEKGKINKNIKSLVDSLGYNYNVDTNLTRTYFPPKEYKGGFLQGGEYLALQVELGEGNGKNYWCVLFPPLCYVDVVVQQEDKASDEHKDKKNSEEEKEVREDKEIRFIVYEWFNDFLSK